MVCFWLSAAVDVSKRSQGMLREKERKAAHPGNDTVYKGCVESEVEWCMCASLCTRRVHAAANVGAVTDAHRLPDCLARP